jgi:Plavaka transposase
MNHTSESSTANQLLTPTPMPSDIAIDHNPTSSDFHPPASYNVPDSTHSDSRPMRTRRLPLRYRDELPEPPPPVIQNPPAPLLTRVILHVFDSIRTNLNIFGIAREYRHRPSYDPDESVSTDELSNIHPSNIGANAAQDSDAPSAYPTSHKPPWPWKNMSIWRLMSWMMTGSDQKSQAEVTRLVKDVMKAEDFNVHDLQHFDAHTEMKRFNASDNSMDPSSILENDGWKKTDVEIIVPSKEKNRNGNGRPFSVSGLVYRPLTAVIKAAFSEQSSKWFHFTPFKRVWKSPVTGQEQRLYDELYTSDAWIEAHDELQKQRRDDGCKLERVVAGLMFWSDSTRLAHFGNASTWPLYLFFGNLSKYVRSRPNASVCHPVAFIPTVSVKF